MQLPAAGLSSPSQWSPLEASIPSRTAVRRIRSTSPGANVLTWRASRQVDRWVSSRSTSSRSATAGEDDELEVGYRHRLHPHGVRISRVERASRRDALQKHPEPLPRVAGPSVVRVDIHRRLHGRCQWTTVGTVWTGGRNERPDIHNACGQAAGQSGQASSPTHRTSRALVMAT